MDNGILFEEKLKHNLITKVFFGYITVFEKVCTIKLNSVNYFDKIFNICMIGIL